MAMLFLFSTYVHSQGTTPYKVGQTVEDITMFDFNSKRFTTKNNSKNIYVLFFISNNCENTQEIVEQLKGVYAKHKNDVEIWAVNSNHPNFSPENSEPKMKEFAAQHKFEFPYLVDLGQIVASDFGIKQNPYAIIMKRDAAGKLRLVYRGIITEGNSKNSVNVVDKNIYNLLKSKPVVNSSAKQKTCNLY